MQLADLVAEVPEDVGAVFEPILPAVVGQGIGCKPSSNRACLHALLYVRITGRGWQFLPKGFPSYQTVQRRLRRWVALDCFHTAGQQLAQRSVRRHGIHGDQVLLDGSKKPSKKGVQTRGRLPWIAVSPVLLSTERATLTGCPSGPSSAPPTSTTASRPRRCWSRWGSSRPPRRRR